MNKALTALVVLAFLAFTSVVGMFGASEGTHTGFVTATEFNQGVLFATHVAYIKTNPETAQEDKYCVRDPAVFEELRTHQKAGQRVTIEFQNPIVVWAWECAEGISIIRSVVES